MKNEKSGPGRYVEVQYLWQQPLAWLVWVAAAIILFALRNADIIDESFAIVATCFVLAIILLVFFTKLTTEINSDGIRYRMWPFHKKARIIEWPEVEDYKIQKYKPLREYGGWGVRVGIHAKAYTVKGNIGLHIKLTSGKNILIGTQNASDMEDFLGDLRRSSKI
jgi:hypothetical protein